ncbi:MAG: tetratricopeptide repeat protein [Rubripirellula sp.]|nr:tetratricopeptide repeat protein [Rubripirellula sp.]
MTESTISGEGETESPSPGSALIVGVALILCAIWMSVWRGALEGVFHFDDFHNIVENEKIRDLWPVSPYLRGNRPAGTYSFAINYYFSGLDPVPFHATNLAIHLANGLLLFSGCLLSIALFQKKWKEDHQWKVNYSSLTLAGLIATVWVVHPITTQSVTYIVQRYESLSSLGYLGAWMGVLIYLRGRRVLGCICACGFAWLGFLSKEVFVSAPLSILLFDLLITRDSLTTIAKRRVIPYLLMLTPLVWFAPSAMRFLYPLSKADPSGGARKAAMGFAMETVSPWEYLRTQPEVIWHYLSLIAWPQQLCIDYVWRIQDNALIYIPLGVLILGMIAAGVFCYWRGAVRRTSFGVGLAGWLVLSFFFILAPTSSFVPIADIAVEHRVYLASSIIVAGVCLLGNHLAGRLLRDSQNPAVLKLGFLCIIAAMIGSLAWRTHLRNRDYQDGLLLWQSTTDVSPRNPRAWYNIGRELVAGGDWDGAVKPMTMAVGNLSTSVPMYDIGLAECLSHTGRKDDAVKLFLRALEKSPNDAETLNDLGVLYMQQGRTEKALETLEASSEMGYSVASHNLGILQKQIGNEEAALTSFQRALQLQPTLISAIRRQAWILATSLEDALRDGKRAVAMLAEDYRISESDNAFGWDAYAAALAEIGQFEQAVSAAERALELARQSEKPDLAAAIEVRLAHFKNGQPHRDDGSDQDGLPNQGDEP